MQNYWSSIHGGTESNNPFGLEAQPECVDKSKPQSVTTVEEKKNYVLEFCYIYAIFEQRRVPFKLCD